MGLNHRCLQILQPSRVLSIVFRDKRFRNKKVKSLDLIFRGESIKFYLNADNLRLN